ncbi:outer membrane beta-barrel protein [Sphingomonas sp.]|uniref:outer membrane beta-barrel protein n=1 Tax=Sphingomonas sp. TaxID=28214 RepID=UPI0035C85484
MRHTRAALVIAGAALATTAPAVCAAQDSDILIQPTTPPEFSRDRNVSVRERARPDYDALGIRAGGFLVFPRLDIGLGADDNIFLSEENPTSAGYAVVEPGVRVQSDWVRHSLTATANGRFRRFFDYSVRNEDNWSTGLLGRLDATGDLSITGEAQAGRVFESPFSGNVDASVSALSSYDYSLLSARAEFRRARNRFALAYNRNRFDFNDVDFGEGTVIDQSNRNRTINGVVAQAERALTPVTSVYVQASYADTAYDTLLAPGIANRDSDGYRVVGGVSMDLPAFLRGTVALGYSWRKFNSPQFRDVSGFSADARVDYFYSELTTFNIRVRRIIQDSQIGVTAAYFDNRLSMGVDHELLRNLILSAAGDVAYQDYIDSKEGFYIYRVSGQARYLISRWLSADILASYSARNGNDFVVNGNPKQFRVETRLSFRL